ncbi:chemotaxis protein CheA [uncultured Erythrobacter sp.]|uniref:chemotaxis protein CheA n=1 Tax=uncultured Erythrobacter sp. TaxID=263913 RepID=UPI00262D97CB|nr:chemotaxis protein CheA [uncultured Erythrobacter sp.]
MDELLAEFVAETREMLEASEGEIIAWEADPADRARLDTIFRFVHTVKGNCGFFDFPRLAALSHAAEDALADVRAGRREADSNLVSAVLAIVDRIAEMVDAIEAGEELGTGGDEALIAALDAGETSAEESVVTAASDEPFAKKADTSIPAQRTIRLPVELLDRVMSGVSDMVLARNDLAHRLSQAGTQPTIDGPFERLTTILSDVRDAITRMRMQRIETLFGALPRLVRDLSSELGKQVVLDLEGGDVELDREMIESVRDPLTHIIRNAIDHGIEAPTDRLAADKPETGTIAIAARQSGNKISIVVSDDGRGLEEDKIKRKAIAQGIVTEKQVDAMDSGQLLDLVFTAGFSTADEVSTVSGRGVGLDVVRANLEKVGGSIIVSSTPGLGTLFYMQVPLTLSIIAGVTVTVGNQRFAIPQSYVEEIVHLGTETVDYTHVGGTALVTFRDRRTRCLSLADVLGIEPCVEERDATLVFLRLANGDLFALAVDTIHTICDLVVKPMPRAIMATELYGGSTLLEDGQPILVLDMPLIAKNNGLVSDTRSQIKRKGEESVVAATSDTDHAMLFTDFAGRRSAIRLDLVQRIETVDASAVESTIGSSRAVIDGTILPLIGLPDGPLPAERIRTLRLTDGASDLLYAVRDIDDALPLTQEMKPVPDDPLVEGITLVNEGTVTLVDGHELFARYGEPPQPTDRPVCYLPDSEWSRTILAPLVESAGYEAIVGKSSGDGIAIVLAEEAEPAPDAKDTAVIRLRSQPEAADDDTTIYRYDREGLLAALRSTGDRRRA